MKKTNRFRAGLIFGISMAIFNVGWNLVIDNNYTSEHLIKLIVSGLIGGAIAGLLFGWLIGIFLKSKIINTTSKIETESDESVLFETPANHFKGIEAVGGRLYLTNKRLIFKSHKLNIQVHELSIDLGEIKSADRHKTLGLVNNGLSITTSQSVTEKFVVEQVEEWVNLLTVKRSSQLVSTT
jgi:phosphate/sulfate permease